MKTGNNTNAYLDGIIAAFGIPAELDRFIDPDIPKILSDKEALMSDWSLVGNDLRHSMIQLRDSLPPETAEKLTQILEKHENDNFYVNNSEQLNSLKQVVLNSLRHYFKQRDSNKKKMFHCLR